MPRSRLDRIYDRADRSGRRYTDAGVGLGGTPVGRTFQKFGRDRPLLGTICQSLFIAAIGISFFSLGYRGRNEVTIVLLSVAAGLLFFLWQFPYNIRHWARDRDRNAEPSAPANRLDRGD